MNDTLEICLICSDAVQDSELLCENCDSQINDLRQKENETVICGDCLYPISICKGCKS